MCARKNSVRISAAEAQSVKRETIRHAAYHCFTQKGYHQTTIDDICDHASISKGSFYWYFESKQDIFVSILDAWAREVEEEVLKQFQNAFEQKRALLHVLSSLKREVHRSRHVLPIWLEFLTQAPHSPEIKDTLARFQRRIRKTIMQLFQPLLQDRATKEQLFSFASLVLAAFFGLLCQHSAESNAPKLDSQLNQLHQLATHFLVPATAASRSNCSSTPRRKA